MATEPRDSRQHSLDVYEIDTDNRPITVAMGEVAKTFYLAAVPDDRGGAVDRER